MGETYTQQKQKLEFKDLVLQHLKRILEITTLEFRGGYYKEVVVGNVLTKEYVPDTRKQYIQSVESFSDILLPHFDNEIDKSYKEISKQLKTLATNIAKKKELDDQSIRDYTLKKLELCRKLFRELNLLLKRKDYLKGAIYTEDEYDDEESEEE